MNHNYFNLISASLLFYFLYLTGSAIENTFHLPNKSISIVAYVLIFYIVDNFLLLVNLKLSFSNIFILVNLVLIFSLLFQRNNLMNVIKVITSYLALNVFNTMFFENLTRNKNIIGDVEDIHLSDPNPCV